MTFLPPLPTLIFIFIYIALLLRLSWIDFRERLLPDNLTYPLLWTGLLFHVFISPDSLASAVTGAVAGYLTLWSLYWCYFYLRKREGIGYGDIKLLAALGAWHGWQNLQWIVLIAAGCGLAMAGITKVWRVPSESLFTTPLPFGPCLAIAGGVTGWFNHYPLQINAFNWPL
ncbi:A24 family peptidase [Enterobacteriaceae bacterium H20N1]|uniref:A24 family peptidase n=1 Tax=Dryocola boscaweniae TaxID=2925397 RepID=A0A9X2W9T7_9ENTR|nr:A24 family peptidase [Dryocola boscaweniae]MCT4703515.1 A24 family peptidase [Dryocola boscaweniae]MCT4720683.1 A24 family peptidase [Dryocola boscaweniae]